MRDLRIIKEKVTVDEGGRWQIRLGATFYCQWSNKTHEVTLVVDRGLWGDEKTPRTTWALYDKSDNRVDARGPFKQESVAWAIWVQWLAKVPGALSVSSERIAAEEKAEQAEGDG